jgi:tetratricopeptide (TPR) repeat protein
VGYTHKFSGKLKCFVYSLRYYSLPIKHKCDTLAVDKCNRNASGEQVRRHYRNHLKLAAVVVVGLLVVGAAGSYVYWRLVPSAATTVKQAQVLDTAGDYTQAYSELNSAYSRAIFKGDKISILVWLAATKYDMGDYQSSLTYYEKLNQMQPNNADNVEMLASVAFQVGNKKVALSADQQELQFLKSAKPQAPTTGADILGVEQQIAGLQQ